MMQSSDDNVMVCRQQRSWPDVLVWDASQRSKCGKQRRPFCCANVHCCSISCELFRLVLWLAELMDQVAEFMLLQSTACAITSQH